MQGRFQQVQEPGSWEPVAQPSGLAGPAGTEEEATLAWKF